jgi:restriction system protein
LQGTNFLVPALVIDRLTELLQGRLYPLGRDDATLRNARQAMRDHRDHVRGELLARVRALAPGEFERLMARLLEALGYEDVSVVGRAGDRGIDIRAKEPGRLGPAIDTVVQVKRFGESNKVAGRTVRNVRGSRDPASGPFW